MKRAWLYCTKYAPLEVRCLGEVGDEGSLRDLIKEHCSEFDDSHAVGIHLIVEGSPEYDEAKGDQFPWLLPMPVRLSIADRAEMAR